LRRRWCCATERKIVSEEELLELERQLTFHITQESTAAAAAASPSLSAVVDGAVLAQNAGIKSFIACLKRVFDYAKSLRALEGCGHPELQLCERRLFYADAASEPKMRDVISGLEESRIAWLKTLDAAREKCHFLTLFTEVEICRLLCLLHSDDSWTSSKRRIIVAQLGVDDVGDTAEGQKKAVHLSRGMGDFLRNSATKQPKADEVFAEMRKAAVSWKRSCALSPLRLRRSERATGRSRRAAGLRGSGGSSWRARNPS
jgi:hypothetical protein